MKNELLIFTRYPHPGTTKTRLIPALGESGAADFHRLLTERTIEMTDRFANRHACSVKIFYQGGSSVAMQQWLGPRHYHNQAAGTLGQRLEKAFEESFTTGHTAVIAIGSDCPGLSSELLGQAVESLDETDLVLGPAVDGGYYLIGLAAPHPELFRDIDWGGTMVLQQTLKKAEIHHLNCRMLKALHDIDRPEDIQHFGHYPGP